MSSRSFRSVFMVASCAGAALGCYLVSLRVASERAALEDVETRIVLAQRDLRMVQTEIGTRGRLSQLERWNAGAFALSAPSADQFIKGGFELARLAQPEHKVDFQAPVVLASAPAPAPHRLVVGEPEADDSGAPAPVAANALLHQASLKIETREVPARPSVKLPPTAARPTDKPAAAAKPAPKLSVDKPGLAAAHHSKSVAKVAAEGPKKAVKNNVDKPAFVTAKALTKPIRVAKADPLAPLPVRHSGHSRDTASDR
jgi:hypothetical protein